MLLEKPSGLAVCWPESTFLVNYEVETLPLLFASDEDFGLYYDTMHQMHSRKARPLEEVRRVNAKARGEKLAGNPLACVELLQEGCRLRQTIFAAGDYQITAAVEHLIWSQIHMASLLLADNDSTTAHRLFTAAAAKIKDARGANAKKRGSGDGADVTLPRKTIEHLSLVLNHNWANYWARRGKWNAAAQHSEKAQSHWNALCGHARLPESEHRSAVDEFLAARLNVANCGTWTEPNLEKVFKATSHYNRYAELLDPVVPEQPSSDPDQESQSTLHHGTLVTVTLSPAPPPSGVQSETNNNDEPELSLTLCLSTPHEPFATTWPLFTTLGFIQAYCHAYAAFALRKYPKAEQALQSCATIASIAKVDCNPHWWRHVDSLHALVAETPGADKASGFRMNKDDMMQKDVLGVAKLLRDQVALEHKSRGVSRAG